MYGSMHLHVELDPCLLTPGASPAEQGVTIESHAIANNAGQSTDTAGQSVMHTLQSNRKGCTAVALSMLQGSIRRQLHRYDFATSACNLSTASMTV